MEAETGEVNKNLGWLRDRRVQYGFGIWDAGVEGGRGKGEGEGETERQSKRWHHTEFGKPQGCLFIFQTAGATTDCANSVASETLGAKCSRVSDDVMLSYSVDRQWNRKWGWRQWWNRRTDWKILTVESTGWIRCNRGEERIEQEKRR